MTITYRSRSRTHEESARTLHRFDSDHRPSTVAEMNIIAKLCKCEEDIIMFDFKRSSFVCSVFAFYYLRADKHCFEVTAPVTYEYIASTFTASPLAYRPHLPFPLTLTSPSSHLSSLSSHCVSPFLSPQLPLPLTAPFLSSHRTLSLATHRCSAR